MKLKSRTDSYFQGIEEHKQGVRDVRKAAATGKETKLSMHELYFQNERQLATNKEENIDLNKDVEGKPMKAFSDDSSQKRYEVEQNESDMSNEDGGALKSLSK